MCCRYFQLAGPANMNGLTSMIHDQVLFDLWRPWRSYVGQVHPDGIKTI